MKWPRVKMEQIAEVVSGFGFPREYQGSLHEQYPFFKVGDMNLAGNERCMHKITNTISEETLKKLKASTFPQGTVIFPKIGAAIATNKKRMLVRPSVVDNNVMGLIPNQHINEWYLYYWMQQFDLRSVSNIGPVPSMRKTEVEKLLVPLPPPSEQRLIVDILKQADALRKKRADADIKATRILHALFYKMFGDPATNPKRWKSSKLGDAILETQYGTSNMPNTDGGGIPILRMNNIDMDGYLNLTDLKYVVLPESERQKYSLANGDLLFNRTNSKELVGKTGLWRGEMEAVPASYLIRVRVDCKYVLPEFIWAYMNCSYIKQMLLNKARRAIGMANINASELRSLPLILPNKDQQEMFARQLDNLEKLRRRRMEDAEIISRLFENILRRAFTGDLTAKWREAHMKELLAEMEEQAKILRSSVEANRM